METPLVFLYNSFLIFATLTLVYLVRRRVFARILISVFWVFLGTCNGYLLLKRVTPFNAQDLKVLSDALELTGNYFSPVELVLLIIGIAAVVLWVDFYVEKRRTVYRENASDSCSCRERAVLCALHIPDE